MNNAGDYDLTPRPFRSPTDREIRQILASTVPGERNLVRHTLLNLPVRRGLKACASYIEGNGANLSQESVYLLYRCLAWVSGEDDGTKPQETGEQICFL